MQQPIGYAICLDNKGYEASLELRKLYPVLAPEANDPAEYIRLVDESSEDYLYAAADFELVALSPHVARRLSETFA